MKNPTINKFKVDYGYEKNKKLNSLINYKRTIRYFN